MDDKTLEYMKERVQKAIDLKSKIGALQDFTDYLDAGDQMDISIFKQGYGERSMERMGQVKASDIYGMFAATVRCQCLKLIQEYQKELDEI